MQLSVVQFDHDDTEFEHIKQIEITSFLCFVTKKSERSHYGDMRTTKAMIDGLLWRDMRSIGPLCRSWDGCFSAARRV